MGLREVAENDLGTILEDEITGFGWPITITNPEGASEDLIGYSNDISAVIDPDTGQVVPGQLVSVALRLSSLIDAGMGIPRDIADRNSNPWVVKFEDLHGEELTFKVKQSFPDSTLGLVTCVLEDYVDA